MEHSLSYPGFFLIYFKFTLWHFAWMGLVCKAVKRLLGEDERKSCLILSPVL